MTMTEAVEEQHMLRNYRPSKEALEYAEKLNETYQNVVMRRACLDAMMPKERQVELYNSAMQNAPARYADNLAYAFRKGIIKGLEDYGDNRSVPTIDEIHAAARNVLDKEREDFAVREKALLTREEITFRMSNGGKHIRFPAPVDIPIDFDEYSYIGGVFFLDDVDMSLEEGLRECLEHTIDDWLMELPGVAIAMRPKKPFYIPEIEIVHVTAPEPDPNFGYLKPNQRSKHD